MAGWQTLKLFQQNTGKTLHQNSFPYLLHPGPPQIWTQIIKRSLAIMHFKIKEKKRKSYYNLANPLRARATSLSECWAGTLHLAHGKYALALFTPHAFPLSGLHHICGFPFNSVPFYLLLLPPLAPIFSEKPSRVMFFSVFDHWVVFQCVDYKASHLPSGCCKREGTLIWLLWC